MKKKTKVRSKNISTKLILIIGVLVGYLILGLSIIAKEAGINNAFIKYYVAICFFLGVGLLGLPFFAILMTFYDKVILPRIKYAIITEKIEVEFFSPKKLYEIMSYIAWFAISLFIGLIILMLIDKLGAPIKGLFYPICFLSGIYVYGLLSGFFMEIFGYQYEERAKMLEEIKKSKKIIITKKDYYRVGTFIMTVGILGSFILSPSIINAISIIGIILMGFAITLMGKLKETEKKKKSRSLRLSRKV